MNLTTYILDPPVYGGEFFNALLFNKAGWSLPSATPTLLAEPVVGITIDNTKVVIIIETAKQFPIYIT